MTILDDVLQTGLKVVFCGSAVGARSALRKAYYAGPGNQFWPVLFRVGLTNRQLAPEDYRIIIEFGFGLTDINKLEAGSDRSLSKRSFDAEALHKRILHYAPRFLAFNGKKSAQMYFASARKPLAYGLQPERIGSTQIFILPSTSGAARGFWDEKHWHALAGILT